MTFLDGVDDRPVWPRADLADMIDAFGGRLPTHGTDAADVIAELAERADPGLVAIPGGRFFGFVIGGTLPAALGADWLVSAWDQNSGSSALTPATVALERVAGEWVCDLLGLPADAAVGWVTGRADLQLRVPGRRAARGAPTRGVGRHPAGVARRATAAAGRRGAPPRVRRPGRPLRRIGSEELVVVRADDQGRMIPAELESALAAGGDGPTVVCLQAGEVHTGAFDPFAQLVPIARRHDAWVHVDGAFGLWASSSERLRHLTAGAGDADSWTTDAHKTLNVPYDCGIAVVRDPADAIAFFRTGGDYLMYTSLDPWDVNPELSRRGRGVPAWAALRSLGRDGVAELVDRLHARARQLETGLRAIPGVEVVHEVPFTQVMFRLGDDEATQALGRRDPGRGHGGAHRRAVARAGDAAVLDVLLGHQRLTTSTARWRRSRDWSRADVGRARPVPGWAT